MSQITLDMTSAGLLAFGAVVCFDIFLLRSKPSNSMRWRQPEWVWILASTGLLYLCADEFFDLHSQYDYWIHSLMGWNETALTDRIDDAIIGLYIIGAILVLWAYRHELWNAAGHRRPIQLLSIGFVLAGVHVCCDMLSNRNDFWHLFLQEPNANIAYRWTSWTEQVTEIGAEVSLVGALVVIWRRGCNQCKVIAGTSRVP